MPAHESIVPALDRLRFPADLCFDRSGQAVFARIAPASHAAGQGYDTRIWRFGLDGSARAVTSGPNSDALPRLAPVGDRLAFTSDRAVAGKMALFLLDGGEARPVGDIPGTVEDVRWSPDGASLLALAADAGLDGGATAGATRLSWGGGADPEVTGAEARRRLFRVSVEDGTTEEVGPAGLTVWEFSPLGGDGALALVSAEASERGWYRAKLARLDFRDRSATVLHETRWQLQSPAVDPSGRTAAFLEGWSSDRGLVAGEIRLLSLDTGEVTTIAPAGLGSEFSGIASIQWRDDDSLWFAGWSGLGSTYGVVTRSGVVEWMEREQAVIGPNSFFAHLTPAPDGTAFAAVREAVGEPPEIVVKTAAGAPWTRVSRLNDEAARGIEGYPEVREVAWAGADGLEMRGFLLLPPDRAPGPLPTVVDIHGGPTWSVKHAFNPGFALPLAAAGFAVFLPNYRGNVGWGQDFARLNIGDPGGKEFEDILRGVDWCVAEGFSRPDRLGVTGGSYGGYMTAWAVATTDRFRAAVMVSGIANHWSCHYSCNHAFSEFIVGGPLTEERFRRLAVDRSPMTRLDRPQPGRAMAPTLILHGREDRCTPLGQGQEFYAALVERGVPAELVVYPREGHGFHERDHRIDLWRRTVGWFDRHLRPDE